MHALLIEDDYIVTLLVEDALRPLGYSAFDRAESVADAVRLAARACPDLIVANHRIVDGTGTDAVLAICADKSIPVVFVTASRDEVQARLPDALIVDKPFVSAILHDAVRKAVERPFLPA
ncbi:MAG: response regulator [Allosphingosinicella sp.]